MPPQAYYCTRPGCPQPENHLENHLEENDPTCQACGMPLILSGPRGRYQPIKPLGKGGFGETFQAVNLGRLNQDYCVIKRLYINPKNLSADKTPEQKAALKQAIEKAFEREARVLESLGDQTGQIPSLYDYFSFTAPSFGEDTDFEYKYIVQQYIKGEDLSQELKRRGRFSESEIIDVLKQILPVLELIHRVNYDGKLSIHRDIKPSNIIREQGTNKLVLIDFGAVKQIKPGESDPKKSVVFGTPGYAPPEQESQESIVDPSTDLYALAASCIQLLTKDNLKNIRNYAYQWQWRNRHPNTVSNELADILDKMLHPQPEERYPSAADVIKAIEAVKEVTPENQKTNQDGEVIKAVEKVTPKNKETNSGNDDQTEITYTGKQQLLKLLIGGAAVMMAVFIYIIIPPRPQLSMLKDPATGIELNYPQNWRLQPKNINPFTSELKFQLTPTNLPSSPYSPSVFISQKDLPLGETLTGYTNFYLQELKDKGHIIDTSQEITINQLPGYQVVYTNKQDPNTPVRFLETWMIYQGKLYILTYSAEEQFYSQFASTVKKDMLPSWKINLPTTSP